MTMNRRDVLKGSVALSVFALMPGSLRAAPSAGAFQPRLSWRTYDVTTRLELRGGDSVSAWIPLPSVADSAWIRPINSGWSTNAATATVHVVGSSEAKFLYAHWPRSGATPVVEVRARVATRDRAVDLSAPSGAPPRNAALGAEQRRMYLAGTQFVPVDGIVRETADRITAGAGSDIEKVRRIYDWIVVNTYRDLTVRGCGSGDVVALLKSGPHGGKCADINALFVGLARASGVPARELYGVRIARSDIGYKSLGADGDITTAQHCRAEVHLSGFGWVPMDPADVRKVIAEEPGHLQLGEPRVEAVRRMLFGAWETNWIAYNDQRDVALPGSNGPRVPFLMYPQAEIAGTRLDCLDPENFRYRITSREVVG